MEQESKLGKEATDIITGFTGVITSEHKYLTGCTQYGLQPKVSEKGILPKTEFFDENRIRLTAINPAIIQHIDNQIIMEETPDKKTGCDFRERP